jgi:hypothetical protein
VVGLAPRIGPDGCGDVASVLLEATAEKIEWIREAVTDDAGNAAGSYGRWTTPTKVPW